MVPDDTLDMTAEKHAIYIFENGEKYNAYVCVLVHTIGRKMDVETIANVVLRFRNTKECIYVFSVSGLFMSSIFSNVSVTIVVVIVW